MITWKHVKRKEMRYIVDKEQLLNELEKTVDQNRRLVEEIRNLRCLLVEAASSISPIEEPVLFAQLTGNPEYFVTDDYNPYPEHDDHVSAQYLDFLSYEAQKNGI